MDDARWQKVEELFHATLPLTQDERKVLLSERCHGDAALRGEVESLLGAGACGDWLLEDSLGEAACALLDESEPRRLGAYTLQRRLGEGGMGTVYVGVRSDDEYRQEVAVKLLRTGMRAPELILRFRAERQILAILAHPNIARLLDGGVTPGGVPYLVMEYIDGIPIDRFIRERGLSIRERLELFRRVCGAVQYAHQHLIVHRDLKPENLLVTAEGEPKLLDFGIAKLLAPEAFEQTVAHTVAAERLMTPRFASPEQLRGENITTATDVYGLGVLLYEILTGRPAFETKDLPASAVERLICETYPARPSSVAVEKLPADLDNIVQKAMHKEPGRRYASAAELAEDVRRHLEGFPISARADSWKYRASKFVARHRRGVTAAGLMALIILGLMVGLLLQTKKARREANTAARVSEFLTSLFRFSRPDVSQGRTLTARDILDLGAARIPKELANDPALEAQMLTTIGRTYYSLGALDRAEDLGRQAVDLSRRKLGKDSETEGQADGYILGLVAAAHGNYDDATKEYETSLRIFRRQYGAQSREVAGILNNLAIVEKKQQNWAAAESHYRESLAIYNKVTGPLSDGALLAKGNLALLFYNLGDYSRAEPLMREVLADRIQTQGPKHPSVAIGTGNLAELEKAEGQWKLAEATERTALDRYRAAYGAKNYMLLNVTDELAYIEGQLGRYDEALRLNTEAMNSAVTLVGARSPMAEMRLRTRAWILNRNGETGLARKTIEEAVSIAHEAYPPGDLHEGDAYSTRGEIALTEHKLDEAAQDFSKSLTIREKQLGRQGVDVGESLIGLGDVERARGNFAAAEDDYRAAIAAVEKRWRGAHTTTAKALFGWGKSLLDEGKPQEAKAPLEKSLEMRQALLPKGHPDITASETAFAAAGGRT